MKMNGFSGKSVMVRPLVVALLLAGLGIAPARAGDPAAEEVLATWGGKYTLTTRDFEADLRTIPAEDRFQFRMEMKRITKVLENILVNRTLADRARADKLDQDPVVQLEMQQAAERILARYYLEKKREATVIPDLESAARENYLVNIKNYLEPERLRASHVLIGLKGRTDDEAAKLAGEIHRRALSGEDFAKLAEEFSDDPGSKSKGGDLGYFTRNKMVKAFEEAAFALTKEGDISPVVKTRFGYHVIKLADRKPERTKPYEEVREPLLKALQQKYRTDREMELLAGIRNDPTIVLNTDAIDRLKTSASDVRNDSLKDRGANRIELK